MTQTVNSSSDKTDWSKILLPLSILLVLVFYFPDAHLLWDAWMNSEEFSHGPLMLGVSLYLLWKRKDLLLRPDPRGRYLGVLVTIGSIALYC